MSQRRFTSFAMLLVLTAACHGQDEKLLVLTTADGKEVKATRWKFTKGTRHASWLDNGKDAPPKEPAPKGKSAAPRVGPEYFEIREGTQLLYKEGVATLVPLAAVRALEFDKAKKTVTVKVATDAGMDEVLTGLTEFIGINKYAIEIDVERGQLGTMKETYKGGEGKDGVASIRFPSPVPVKIAKLDRPVTILTKDKVETKHVVGSVQPLYQVPSGLLRTWPLLYFQKSVKIEFAKLKGLRHVPAEDLKLGGTVLQVVLPDGRSLPLRVIEQPRLAEDLAPPRLVGLLGVTPLGFKIFPLPRVDDMSE
jgi:hypothetical protein